MSRVSEKNSRAQRNNVFVSFQSSAIRFCHEGEIGSERITVSHGFRGSFLNLYLEVQR